MPVQKIFDTHYEALRERWLELLVEHPEFKDLGRSALQALCWELLNEVSVAADTATKRMRSRADRFARRAASLGIDTRQTAAMILLLKRPMYESAKATSDMPLLWEILEFVDALAMQVMTHRLDHLLQLTEAQRQEVLELSTPVVSLWDGIILIPLIGTMDSERSAAVLESLLTGIESTNAEVAILDISGVPTIDAQVARRLVQAASAVHLMGAELLISGVGPRIAQTVVTLGLDLGKVTTTNTLARAFERALQRRGLELSAARPG